MSTDVRKIRSRCQHRLARARASETTATLSDHLHQRDIDAPGPAPLPRCPIYLDLQSSVFSR
jgi:hypothetical protein